MKKPEWADHWNEEDFDYGMGRGFAAQVGPIRNAVRIMARKKVKDEVLGEFTETTERHWCEDCEDWHEHATYSREVLEPAVWVDVGEPRAEDAEAQLKYWFENKVKESKEFLLAALKNGLG